MRTIFWKSTGLLLVLSLVVACASLAEPELHSWAAPPILVELYQDPGSIPHEPAFSSTTPRFVLYADGHLVVSRFCYTAECEKRTVFEEHLEPDEVCRLLQSIESNGFFSFDFVGYRGPGATQITVNSWQTRTVAAYALSSLSNQGIHVPEELAKTYEQLKIYDSHDLRLYRPSQVALLITDAEPNAEASNWPLTTPSLTSLVERVDKRYGYVILEGQEAQAVYDLIGDNVMQSFQENGTIYRLTPRPLLPLENLELKGSWPYPTTPTIWMTCTVHVPLN